ncbi:MAG: lysine--tRNA ligase [Actinomycetota bacterium]|nr:lysine--tRNA ligase [Actinomycetota bacterium]
MTDRDPAAADLSEQERVRRDKRQRLIESGEDAYPITVPRTRTLRELRQSYDDAGLEPGAETTEEVAVTGRVIYLRDTGKLCFARLREGDGTELQVMLSSADVGADRLDAFKTLVDIGDHLAAAGRVVMSRRGELSVRAHTWQMAAKAVRPLPGEHHLLSDEARVRHRYLDMIVRSEAREMVRAKATVLKSLRSSLDARGYVEVDTPVLQLTNGGAAARPFRTHLNTFDQQMLLRIALELDLKRAMVGGVERVYEIGKTFRNEGIDSTHNAEFLMLEAYEAYGDYESMMELVQTLVVDAGRALGHTIVPGRDGTGIDLEAEWRRATLLELVSDAVGTPVSVDTDPETLRRLAGSYQVELRPSWGSAEILLELYERLVEHTLIRPTFVCDYPERIRPLAKAHRASPGLVEAFDLVINGVELVAAYSELNDPVLQRARLEDQARQAAAGNPEANDVDEVFLRALEHGMPPAGGMGMGVDRLLMLLMGTGIREAILFPLLRPEA